MLFSYIGKFRRHTTNVKKAAKDDHKKYGTRRSEAVLEIGQITATRASTLSANNTASKADEKIRLWKKNKKLPGTFRKVFKRKRGIISIIFFCFCQTIAADAAAIIKRIVQIIPIVLPSGVQEGRFIPWYQIMPLFVKILPTTAVIIVVSGIKK